MINHLNESLISRRDYFALAALQGLTCTIDHSYYEVGADTVRSSVNRMLVKTAIALADEMLAQLDPLNPNQPIGLRLLHVRSQRKLSVIDMAFKLGFEDSGPIEEAERLKVCLLNQKDFKNQSDYKFLKSVILELVNYYSLDPKDFIEMDV